MVDFAGWDCYMSVMDLEVAAKRLAELGNATRLQIVRLLVRSGRGGLAIGEIQARLGIPASTLAFHLRGLVVGGLVDQERNGRVVHCRPNFDVINETLAFVKENCCVDAAVDRPRRKGSAG